MLVPCWFTLWTSSRFLPFDFFLFSCYITARLDYNKTVQDLIFSRSVRHIVVRVPIVQDAFSEETEQFRASLSLVESNGINVTLSPEQATVNITDDEGISIMN